MTAVETTPAPVFTVGDTVHLKAHDQETHGGQVIEEIFEADSPLKAQGYDCLLKVGPEAYEYAKFDDLEHDAAPAAPVSTRVDNDLPFPVSEEELEAAGYQSTQGADAPAELPGTPLLLGPADIIPGTLGVVDAPLHQTVKSPCNVRMHYDADKTAELAAGMKADGQLQECIGRWNAAGELEIVAGETRRRAQVLREEQGETGLTLRVNVKDLTDAQALRISTQENLQRKSMTPLEECEAMLRMREAGDTVENIQATFGYQTAQPVADRILVAKNLHTKGREALDARQISLAQAFVIARAPGAETQKNMLTSALDRWSPASAKSLAEMLTRGQFLVANAKFDVEASGLEVRQDLFGTFEPYFENKAKALEAQLAWAEQKAEKLRKKGKHAFVDVYAGDFSYCLSLGHGKYEREYGDKGPDCGLLLFIDQASGEFKQLDSIKLKVTKKAATTKMDGTTTTETVREMPASAHEAAHLHRATALRQSLLGQTQITLVLTVHGLIANYPYYGKAPLGSLDAWNGSATTPEIQAKLTSWQAAIAAGIGGTPVLGNLGNDYRHNWNDENNLKLYDFLTTLDTPDLLDLLNVLVACRIYEPNTADYRKPQAPLFNRLAQQTGSNAVLARDFKLNDEWLKRYPRHELVALAEEAGLGRALVEDCKTAKDMRGRILEHLPELEREGFLPKFVAFPELPTADAPAQAADD